MPSATSPSSCARPGGASGAPRSPRAGGSGHTVKCVCTRGCLPQAQARAAGKRTDGASSAAATAAAAAARTAMFSRRRRDCGHWRAVLPRPPCRREGLRTTHRRGRVRQSQQAAAVGAGSGPGAPTRGGAAFRAPSTRMSLRCDPRQPSQPRSAQSAQQQRRRSRVVGRPRVRGRAGGIRYLFICRGNGACAPSAPARGPRAARKHGPPLPWRTSTSRFGLRPARASSCTISACSGPPAAAPSRPRRTRVRRRPSAWPAAAPPCAARPQQVAASRAVEGRGGRTAALGAPPAEGRPPGAARTRRSRRRACRGHRAAAGGS